MLPARGANFKRSFWATRQEFFFAVPAWHSKLGMESQAPMPSMVRKKTQKAKKRPRKAGHRLWAAGNALVAGAHRGDIMSPQKRSELMSRIRWKNTGPEQIVFAELRRRGIYFAKHAKNLPGRPDIVFRRIKLAVFIDGDFWHGWRFPLWAHKLPPRWRAKIASTRERDHRNFRRLRRLGWRVLRIWEHAVEDSPERSAERILAARGECLADVDTLKAMGFPDFVERSPWHRTVAGHGWDR
jgi:DNA mismatch endonuclease (patch repair protein)